MTLQELQKQVLQLSTSDRWQLVHALLESLKQEAHPKLKRKKIYRGYEELLKSRQLQRMNLIVSVLDSKETKVIFGMIYQFYSSSFSVFHRARAIAFNQEHVKYVNTNEPKYEELQVTTDELST